MLWMAQPPAGWRDFKANAQADFYAEMGENGGGRQSHRDEMRDPSAKKTMLDIAADYDRLAKKSEEVGAPTGRERKPTRQEGRCLTRNNTSPATRACNGAL